MINSVLKSPKLLLASSIALVWSAWLLMSPFDSFTTQTAAGFILLFAWLSWVLAEKFDPWIGVSYFYFSMVAVPRFCFPQYFFQGFNLETIIGFEAVITQGHFYLTAIIFVFFFMRWRTLEFTRLLMVCFAYLMALVSWGKFMNGNAPYYQYSLFNNSAIDCVFISCCLPSANLYLKGKQKWWLLFLAGPLVFTQTSTGIFGLGMFLILPLIRRANYIWSIGAGAAVSAIGIFTQGEALFNSSGRVLVWKQTMPFWWQYLNHIVGAGVGTYFLYGPSVQINNLKDVPDGYVLPAFFWAHSDPLQILFETGYIGLILSIIVCVRAIYKSRNRPWLFDSLILYTVTLFWQMSLRHVLLTCLGALFVTIAFRDSAQEPA